MKATANSMKKAILIVMTMVLVWGLKPLASQAQDNPTFFVIVDFMKVKAGNEGKYVDVEKNIWKPIHQERINQGEITGWILYRVHYTGSADEYNFVTAAVFKDPAKLEHTFSVDVEKVHPGKDMEKAFDETMKSRDLVKQQLLRRVDAIYPEGGPGDFKYIQVNSMKTKPGAAGDYISQEVNVWKPVHKELVNDGAIAGWSLWERVYPAGSAMDYDYVTVDYYKDFSQIGAADLLGAFEKVHLEKEPMTLINATEQTRDRGRVELWEVIDSVWSEE